ncbi:hypothetical protein Z517_03812 [Fonsecaea pedrosoi CBS 271.37]|uniref:Uncharacterized protein n=1 Tax=Fonsecaea pedrosoi CBS 271.37 TaxID=1442368 RepID=A0A0D2FD68_9EURO|nr:uncharacterized protein Z517_03812 [Fonsecaea pedrosoi CBS 271.37]KIW84562.1 hypothetical protein Z517_03812 [Fonsecaea pedrosoi CBS 271.37]
MALNKTIERLFKYPPMERQDLNQSQLGSFKFTPVDPVSNISNLTHSAKVYLEQQLCRRLYHGAAPLAADSSTDKPNAFTDTSPGKFVSLPTSSLADANFFNKHIQPDLGDSRLRLGPAALRSAVEGAASPTKKLSVIQLQQEPGATVRRHQQNNSLNFSEVLSSQGPNPVMDPTSTTFTAAGVFASQNPSDSTSFSQTLFVALTNEQQAHNVTKAALVEQIKQRVEVEDELEKSRRQIASMTTTINTLGAIIKYNASKGNGDTTKERQKTETSEEDEEVALREFYREYQKVKDAAKGRHGRKEMEQHAGEERSGNCVSAKENAVDVTVPPSGDVVDDAQLYNLDLLKKPTFDDSADSILRRTLRKHFSIEDNGEDGNPPATPARRRPGIAKLIDISPESVGEVMEKEEVEAKRNMQASKEETTVNASDDIQRQLKATTVSINQVRLLTAQNPVLELPAAFIAKYGQKPPDPKAQVLEEKSNGVSLTKGEAFLLQGSPSKPSNNESYVTLRPSSSLTGDHDDQLANKVVSPAAAQSQCRITVQVGDNLRGEPKWLINRDNPVFESEQKKWQALGECGISWRQNSPFMDHPVRYLPEDAAGTSDAYRTVMIDEIPVASTLPEVLSIVKGGSLESIQLFPPIGKVTTFMTARVVFNHEESAHNMIKHQEAVPGEATDSKWFKIKGVAVRCWMPTDPTYPRNDELERKIFGKAAASRIILISNIDEYTYNMIPYKIKPPYAQHVVEYSYTPDGCVSIEFTDVKSAIRIMDQLERDGEFWNGNLQYDVDYTCAPYVKGEAMGH